jgi:hypothetical protein
MLVLLIEGIFYKYAIEVASCGMMYVPSFMNTGTGIYAIEMGSGAMIYIPSFIKIGAGIPKLLVEGDTYTDTHQGDMLLLLFFQNKESRLRKGVLFVGPQIMEVINDRNYDKFLERNEKIV